MVEIFEVKQDMDLVAKVEEKYQVHMTDNREVQLDCLMKCFDESGFPVAEAVDYCIARIESRGNKRSRIESLVMGIAYPAIILFLSAGLAMVQVFNPENIVYIAVAGILVSIIMMATYLFLKNKQNKNGLLECLYDVKEQLLESSYDIKVDMPKTSR